MTTEVTLTAADSGGLEDFFENGNVGLHFVAKDGTILRANRADYEPLGYTAEEYVGRHIAEFHADPDVIEEILARLSSGERLDKYPARLRARDGSIRHVEISSSVCFRNGEFLNTRCFTVDVTEKRAAEMALHEAQERLSVTYENVQAGIAEVDAEGRLLRVNEAFCEITGYSREELQHRTFLELTHPEDVAADRELFERQKRGENDRYGLEKRYVRKDGCSVWIEAIGSAVRGPDGSFRYGVRMVLDISERKAAEQRQKLLLDELNHRVKNTLATVQSLAAQTARTCTTAAEFRARFEPRLIALSKAHDRLTRNHWTGAALGELVEEELGAHRTRGRVLEANGPELVLPPRASLSLSLALHELATNAAKHGSLAGPGGRVAVEWTVQDQGSGGHGLLSITWTESGEREVEPPKATGFGSRLLRVTAAELGGEMETEFAPSGLRWRLQFPLGEESTRTA